MNDIIVQFAVLWGMTIGSALSSKERELVEEMKSYDSAELSLLLSGCAKEYLSSDMDDTVVFFEAKLAELTPCKKTEYWEVDLRSREDGSSYETIFSGESHDEACAALQNWYAKHPEVDMDADRESLIDGTNGFFADIYSTTDPHGVGKW